MDSVDIMMSKHLALKWFIKDNSLDEPLGKFDCLTIPQFMIELKSKVPFEYLKHINWASMLQSLCDSKKIHLLLHTVKDNKFRYLTTKEVGLIDGRETWVFMVRKNVQ